MNLKIYPVVLELVRRLSPRLATLKARSTSVLALFRQVIGTLVRLIEPR